MPAIRRGWGTILAWAWFACGVGATLLAHALMASGALGVGLFDDALRLLQVVYAARGLRPYVDYGFLYPPGPAWFYGSLLRLTQPGAVIVAMAAVGLVLVASCTALFMRRRAGRGALAAGTLLLLLGAAIPLSYQYSGGPAVPLTLLPIATLLLVEAMRHGLSKGRVAGLLAAGLVATLIRWDWMLFAAVLEVAGASAVCLLARRVPDDPSQPITTARLAARLLSAGLVLLLGIALAGAIMVSVGVARGSWADMDRFVFELPLRILPFRRLPLPDPRGENAEWLLDLIALILLLAAAAIDSAQRTLGSILTRLLQCGALLAPCVAMLPYALGRADRWHFIPLAPPIVVAALVGFSFWPSRPSHWLLLAAIALVAMPVLNNNLQLLALRHAIGWDDDHLVQEHRITAGCTDLFPADARSLFVGQASYRRFIINLPVLYLMRPDLRPATRFISDEPGVQNSCSLGREIAGELARAPRPLVLVLDSRPWPAEPNRTRSMSSCGKIEAAVAALRPVTIGSCRIRGRTLAVLVAR